MVELRKARSSDSKKILILLQKFNNKRITNQIWLNLFNGPWIEDKNFVGYVLTDHEKVVGFYSLIFSNFDINNKNYKFCNFSNWIIDKQYRKYSVSMLMPLKELFLYNLTCFSAMPVVKELLCRMGFKSLNTSFNVIPALPAIKFNKCRLIWNTGDIRAFLKEKPPELKIFEDNIHFNCKHLIIENNGKFSYLLISRILPRGLPGSKILYISNPNIFLDNIKSISFLICIKMKTLAVLLNTRDNVSNIKMPVLSFVKKGPPLVYKSDSLEADQIPYTSSEETLLSLS